MSQRVLAPTLYIPMPDCSVCGMPVSVAWRGYRCEHCGITWDKAGFGPVWDDPEAEQCEHALYLPGKNREARCILTKGHSNHQMHSDGTGFFWE